MKRMRNETGIILARLAMWVAGGTALGLTAYILVVAPIEVVTRAFSM